MKVYDTGIIRKVGEKGEVYIPKTIREALGIEPETPMEFSITDKGILLIPCRKQKVNVEIMGVFFI